MLFTLHDSVQLVCMFNNMLACVAVRYVATFSPNRNPNETDSYLYADSQDNRVFSIVGDKVAVFRFLRRIDSGVFQVVGRFYYPDAAAKLVCNIHAFLLLSGPACAGLKFNN